MGLQGEQRLRCYNATGYHFKDCKYVKLNVSGVIFFGFGGDVGGWDVVLTFALFLSFLFWPADE